MATSSSPVKENAVEISKHSLPDEIVTDIISRLPVKRVFQAQCLSKNFSSIATDPKFVEAHLKHSARIRPSIILNNWKFVDLVQCSSGQVTVKKVPLHRDTLYSASFGKKSMIVGSCNGLAVLAVSDYTDNTNDCFLWNPAINQCNRLPVPSRVPLRNFVSLAWGIGYCTESRVYKIVRLGHGNNFNNNHPINFAEVFSCGTDKSWRRIDFSEFDIGCFMNGTTAKGVVYWEAFNRRLLSFDLEKEKFSWVIKPAIMYGAIMEFKGRLAMCCLSKDEKSFDLWVRKDEGSFDFDSLDYGVDECFWEKIYTTLEFKFSYDAYPVRILNDRHILLLSDGIQVDWSDELESFTCTLYDLESKEIRQIPTLAYDFLLIHNFVESLVSLRTSEYSSSDHYIDYYDEGENYDYGVIDYEASVVMDHDGNGGEQE